MKYKIQVCPIYELGSRDNQEDSLYPAKGKESESDRVFILCDGMGGHDAGEIASSAVCEAMGASVKSIQNDTGEDSFSDADFRNALAAGLSALDARDNGAEKKMGTTMTFLKLHDEGATIAHIGDSRVYHIRPGADAEKTEILFETVDHSLVNDLIKIGELTPEEAKHSRQKNIITRAMQPNMERPPKADLYHTVDILPGDYFYMCSDGMLEEMEDSNIRFIFSERGGDDAAKVKMLTKVTKDNKDNHSAFIIHILEVEDELIQDTPEAPETPDNQATPAELEKTEELEESTKPEAPEMEDESPSREETVPEKEGSAPERKQKIKRLKIIRSKNAENERVWSTVLCGLGMLGLLVIAGAVYYFIKK